MKILIVTVFLLLVMPSMAVQTAGDFLRDYAIQDPNIGQCVVGFMDASHIEATITPGTYSHNMQEAVARVMTGYYGVLLRMPDYNGYLRVAEAGKIVAIWEIEAIEIRSAYQEGGANQVANVIDANAYGKGTAISYYWSDGLGDVKKSVSDGSVGQLSASSGDWL